MIQALGSAVALSSIAACQTLPGKKPRMEKLRRAQSRGLFASTAVASVNKNAQLASLLDQIDPARLTASVADLAGMGTRLSGSPELEQAALWIHAKFASAGYPIKDIQSLCFKLPDDGIAANVVCFPERTDQGFLLVCAHYDSTSQKPKTDAPGADDNASGVAVMLEVARLMRIAFPARPVMYVAFAGEEQNLDGSSALAARAKAEAWPIDLLINLDMVGWVNPEHPSTVIIEFDYGWVSPHNDAASKFYGLRMAQATVDYTSLNVEHDNIWSGDYLPFEVSDVPCIGIYDGGADAPFYHSSNDVPAVVSAERLVQVARILFAFVADFIPFKPLPPSSP